MLPICHLQKWHTGKHSSCLLIKVCVLQSESAVSNKTVSVSNTSLTATVTATIRIFHSVTVSVQLGSDDYGLEIAVGAGGVDDDKSSSSIYGSPAGSVY